MCNAANHPFDCPCGFGGDTGGGRPWGGISDFEMNYVPPSFGWAKDSSGTVESYVNPNAHCPVCGVSVYFYRSPYNGRVYFDDLGWDWPKHSCTDNGREPRRTTRDSIAERSPAKIPWQVDGWTPMLSLRVDNRSERKGIRGDCEDNFLDLVLPLNTKIDVEGPVFARTAFPDLYEITFLVSGHFDTQPRKAVAFHPRLLPLGEEILTLAASSDVDALYTVGAFLLWELDDPKSARPYFEKAVSKNSTKAAVDLLALALFAF